LSWEDVQGKTEHHGLVMVLACGTLHQQDKCVGVFEQLFGLIMDPLTYNNWRNLKSKSTVTSSHTLAEGSLFKEYIICDKFHSVHKALILKTPKYEITLFITLYFETNSVNLHGVHCLPTTEHFPMEVSYMQHTLWN
jgi:hypothetical protein